MNLLEWWRRRREPAPPPRLLADHALRLLRQAPEPAAPGTASGNAAPLPTALTPDDLAAIRVILRARELLRGRTGLTPTPAPRARPED